MDWTQNRVIELIDLLHQRPVLWNQKLNRNKILQREALNEIASTLKFDPKEVERKLNYLRTQFSRELLRVRRSRMNNETYEPKWFAYQALSFLINKSSERNKAKQDKAGDDNVLEQSVYFTPYERKLLAAIENIGDNELIDNNNETPVIMSNANDSNLNNQNKTNEIKYPPRRRSTRKSISKTPIKQEINYTTPVEPYYELLQPEDLLLISETPSTVEIPSQNSTTINTPKNRLNVVVNTMEKNRVEKNCHKFRNPMRYRNFDLLNAKLKFVVLQKKFLLDEHKKKEEISKLQLEHEKYKLELIKLDVEKRKLEIQIRSKMVN